MIPGYELTDIIDMLATLFFLTLRIGAFLLAGPAFGGRFVPLPVRIMASVVMALPLFGRVNTPGIETLSQIGVTALIANELAVGISAGLVASILFGAAALAGDRIANTAGLGFAAQFDPSAGAQVPVISQFFGLFLMVIFIGTDGHLAAFRIILDSYAVLPAGSALAAGPLIAAGITAGTRMFTLGMQIMLPVVAALLLINITVGVFTRSAPQLNVFSFGFPITIGATLVLLFLTFPGTGDAFDSLVVEALNTMFHMINEAAHGTR